MFNKKYIVVIGHHEAVSGKSHEDKLWKIQIPYTAWKLPNADLIAEKGYIVCWVNEKRRDAKLHLLQSEAKENTIILLTGKKKDNEIVLGKIIGPATDNDAEVFLVEQLKPVTFSDGTLGEFALNKLTNSFEGKIVYNGESISISLRNENCLDSAIKIYTQLDKMIMNAKTTASNNLLELANDWGYQAWIDDGNKEEDYVGLTELDFIDRLSLVDISIQSETDVSFWFNDGDIFLGHYITVDGNINSGFSEANI